ncbi:hypothetical protein ORJ04_22280 [Rheinheimera baltica]|uniref:Uncharacterized protein n=1 Tax=Rheinheimera baltica TaxID=67576 RepID=A0ABT9I5N8_9GAMM|nr:hypothetical protein [Rheinheimera baltica]MDP5138679.1 hypothetical protein [Rheinheimera baltica]MDP5148842.1 hypothetical protein [Rheinheimera baltica]
MQKFGGSGRVKFKLLELAADSVISAINTNPPKHASADVLALIKTQMLFIRDNAAAGKKPATELPPNTKFTYAVLASRELTSPDELILQAQIDKVTEILISA